ncbi:MAG: IclR family transcriptional regulator [Clostridiaceae bacterium]|nr:IclR family transcriptional regulator [Clostridiaceae bacterium]
METITKALRLLKTLAEQPMNVTEAAQYLSVHKSSASRLLAAMQEEGFVRLNEQRKYEIGHIVYVLASASTELLNIRNAAHPFMQKLNFETDEAVHLSILSRTNMIYIDKLDARKMVRMYSRVGYSYPAYCTAMGKVLLAYQKSSYVDKLMSNYKFEKFTERTIGSFDELKKELKKIREAGYALDLGENFEEINCIAAPIFNHTGSIVASLSISAPVFYTNYEKLISYKDLLIDTTLQISQKLGYEGNIPPGSGEIPSK